MRAERLQLPAAYMDPAFMACVQAAAAESELLEQFKRLYGVDVSAAPSKPEAGAFCSFVHSCIYMTLPDEAIHALRIAGKAD